MAVVPSRVARRAASLVAVTLLLGAALLAGAAAGRPVAATPRVPSTPDDPLFPEQWNLMQVGAPEAWQVSTGAGVLIGIVDTGVDLDQQDLAGKVAADANCVGSGGNPSACVPGAGSDDNGHGTEVAGIAAADTNNGIGIAGMAPDAHLVVAKALDSQGTGSYADVNAAIEWVVDHGARVVNLSLGDATPIVPGVLGTDSLAPGIEYAWNHGAVPVLAAGNTNYFGLGSANYGNVDAIVVGATGRSGKVTPYSSPTGNAKWAILAPGGNGQDAAGQPACATPVEQAHCIVSTWWTPGNPTSAYAYDEGTSMAAPIVSGTVALLLAMGETPRQAVAAILDHAIRVPCGPDSPTCVGRLDAAAAVGAAAATTQQASSAAGPDSHRTLDGSAPSAPPAQGGGSRTSPAASEPRADASASSSGAPAEGEAAASPPAVEAPLPTIIGALSGAGPRTAPQPQPVRTTARVALGRPAGSTMGHGAALGAFGALLAAAFATAAAGRRRGRRATAGAPVGVRAHAFAGPPADFDASGAAR